LDRRRWVATRRTADTGSRSTCLLDESPSPSSAPPSAAAAAAVVGLTAVVVAVVGLSLCAADSRDDDREALRYCCLSAHKNTMRRGQLAYCTLTGQTVSSLSDPETSREWLNFINRSTGCSILLPLIVVVMYFYTFLLHFLAASLSSLDKTKKLCK